ncbi:MAG: Ig-like domain-containing protein [Sporichthyaceae bacterium]
MKRSVGKRIGLLVAASIAVSSPALAWSNSPGESSRPGKTTSTPRALLDQPDDLAGVNQVHVIYAVPSDGTDRNYDTDDSIRNSVSSWQNWLKGQTGGRGFNLDTHAGVLDVTFVRLTQTDAAFRANGVFIRDAIEADLHGLGFNAPNKIYAVYYDGTSQGASCGGGAWPPTLVGDVGALYLKGDPAPVYASPVCDSNLFASGPTASPGYREFAMVHEVMHVLGFAPRCAPNHRLEGHVGDSPTDLMYAPNPGDPPWNPSVLDFNNNDYFNANRADCPGLESSPFLGAAAVVGAPTAFADSYGTNEDTALTVPGPGVLGNDSDPDGDPLTATLVTGPVNGTVTLNPDGSFTYTPDANFNGADSFTYTASDGANVSNATTVAINVTPVDDDAPTTILDVYSTTEDTALTVPGPGVLGNDSDPDGDQLTAALVTGPGNGTVTLNPDGSFTYTPDVNFNGADSFTYTASDGTLTSPVTDVGIAVNPVNDAPTALADTYATNEDTVLNVPGPGVLGNDTDPDGDPLTTALVAGPGNGAVTLNPDGSFTYTPDANFNGTDTFTYTANDGNGSTTAPATVTIAVNAVNDAPTARADTYRTSQGTAMTVPGPGVLGNDSDPDGDPLTATLVTGPGNGTVTLNPDGSFTYTPDVNFNGTDTFTYTANDGNGGTTTATVTITVRPRATPGGGFCGAITARPQC